ncbi:TetR/AcrR family transcriptional regulator [Mesorhizobium sp. B2-3-4]|uniref:TetR/AcrR family transcriptional regulator n=1 Tax=Mesorhizobium sp. B2-3-4 TaxID=2589959 RepID=UPI0015E34C8E|nr:TetR/AcrR family transcriptional regulator [Mesorhizobium sp. B2-3-4]
MTRPKTRSNEQVLEAALRLIHEYGPEALTFERLAKACGLSGATLVQRFRNKAQLKQRTLLHAWDGLDDRTGALAASMPKTPVGAVKLLVALSQGYGGIQAYAEGLLVLREDLRDPVLRARGAAWKAFLCAALAACFAEIDDPPQDVGLLMASHWQGSLLWWSFDPTIEVAVYVEDSLNRFIATVTTQTAREP